MRLPYAARLSPHACLQRIHVSFLVNGASRNSLEVPPTEGVLGTEASVETMRRLEDHGRRRLVCCLAQLEHEGLTGYNTTEMYASETV